MPTFRERQDLAKRFAPDVDRMRRCLQGSGKNTEDDNIVYAWAIYSDALGTDWLTLPESDEALLETLLKHLPITEKRWQTRVLDAGDGSGDVILPLPEELLSGFGWQEGDKLSVDQDDTGALILRRLE